ncbi:MAG: T9SS type A sorting domain-containing protein [Bacteroidales bacterium]|nr:T9SS type A sorting domain-containing protein [Bacteroidales bacterium]
MRFFKNIFLSLVLFIASLFLFESKLYAQSGIIEIKSDCGYTVHMQITPIRVIPSSETCRYGFNYELELEYHIEIKGRNTCDAGEIGIQPEVSCFLNNSNDRNGYYDFRFRIPKVNDDVDTTYTGTIVTVTSQWRGEPICDIASPELLECKELSVYVWGPGIRGTYNTDIDFSGNLPVELIDFHASCGNAMVEIEWATASEQNNDFFSIERSNNALDWELIGTISGAGNSNIVNNYTFIDNQCFDEIMYYRLLQTDFDGTLSIEKIIQLDACTPNKDVKLILYPNPSQGMVFIETNLSENYEVILFNSTGIMLLQLSNPTYIDLSNYASGIYNMLVVYNSGHSIRKQLILEK